MAAALSLMPYQKEGVRFLLDRPAKLNKKPHRLLADEMGLGKTIQAIAALKLIESRSTLIICTASIKYNWARQMIKWGFCTEDDIYIIRTGFDTIPANASHIIVNYDLLIVANIQKQLMARRYDACICDEAQKLKTLDSKRSKKVLGGQGDCIIARAYWKWLLSGMIIPNRPIEFYPVLKTLAPECIKPHTDWVGYGKYFCNGFEEKYSGWNFKGASHIEELRERLKPFMLRRELKDVYTQLPPVISEVVYFEVDLLAHPECEGLECPEAELPLATLSRITAESKVPQVVEYLKDKLEFINKITVFAYHRKVIEDLQNALLEERPLVIYGGVSGEQKQNIVDKFIEDPGHRILIGQITAAGEGIDGLQEVCSYVVFAELDWSAGAMAQAMHRLHRIGQNKNVFAFYLVANNTIENVKVAVLDRKRSVINRLLAGETEPMSIEAQLERIAVAIEALAGSKPASTPAAGAAKTTPTPTPSPAAGKGAAKGGAAKQPTKPKGPTLDDVRAAALEGLNARGGGADAKAWVTSVAEQFGVSKIGDIPEESFADAIEAYGVPAEEAEDPLA